MEWSNMCPQDAIRLTGTLRALFDKISPMEGELLSSVLEQFEIEIAETVIKRYATETAAFDRGKLRTLLIEEHSRRRRRPSETAKWRSAKEAETQARDAVLDALTHTQLQELSELVRHKYCTFLKVEPQLTDLGRSLIYKELLAKGARLEAVA
jgi:hypothetical protein